MPLTGTISTEDFEHLKERVRKLADDKSHLQLIIHMMSRLTLVPGLENTIENLLNTVLDNLGGTNVFLYYAMNGSSRKRDIFGSESTLQEIDDPFVKQAFETKHPCEEERTEVRPGEAPLNLSENRNWAYPLLVGQEVIGVIVIEGVYARLQHLHNVLPTFFNYAALILKNEIFGFTQLQEAYEELSQANVSMAKEITERKLAESQLQDAYSRLTNAHTQLLQKDKMASIGQLAAGIAHEINTPTQFLSDNMAFLSDALKAVLAFLASLRDESAQGSASAQTPLAAQIEALDLDYLLNEIPQAIQQSQDGLGRVARIVSAMKDFSHPGAEGKSPADLNHAIESTITVAHNEWKYVATLETALDPGLPRVPCFLGEFNQVILNLLVNSAHAIRAAQEVAGSSALGHIRISTAWTDDGVEIQVADTGAGIPESIQSRIFEPFFTTKEVGKGTGLGLSIAYDIIVHKHGGTIRIDSEVGKGTTFILTLPLKMGEVQDG